MRKLFIILSVLIVAVGCGKEDYENLYGKWGTNWENGNYGEIWLDENYILLIEEISYDARIYNYNLSNDSITPLHYSVPNYVFYIKSLDEDKMVLNDNLRDYEFYRISEPTIIDTSSVFEKEVYKEFGLRYTKQKN